MEISTPNIKTTPMVSNEPMKAPMGIADRAPETAAESTVQVEATGPVKYGYGDKIVEYADGETFSVTRRQAVDLLASGAVRKPGSPPAAVANAAVAVSIDEANARADAERVEGAKARTGMTPIEGDVFDTAKPAAGAHLIAAGASNPPEAGATVPAKANPPVA